MKKPMSLLFNYLCKNVMVLWIQNRVFGTVPQVYEVLNEKTDTLFNYLVQQVLKYR